MAVTACNDHWLKQLWPGWCTGKLSDFTDLTFFPFWAAAALELLLFAVGRRCLLGPRVVSAIIVFTAMCFTAIKVSPDANRAYERSLTGVRRALAGSFPSSRRAHNCIDPTDLIALPALGISLWIVRKRDAQRRAATRQCAQV